mmetsp:Transcript_6077/g.9349  ORF Transcript_6077/g.9349 Transcript_6077/m.9349 type:complete len:455 (+) Transcript_6077:33-1397(+)
MHDDDSVTAAGRKERDNTFFKEMKSFFKRLGSNNAEKSPDTSRRGSDVGTGGKQLSVLKAEKREELQKQREKVVALKEQLNDLEMAGRTGDWEGTGDRRRVLEGKLPPLLEPLPIPAVVQKKIDELEEELKRAEQDLKTFGRELHQLLLKANRISPSPSPQGSDEDFLYGWEIDPTEWKMIKKLGEGEFGITFQAEFRGRVVAVKRLKLSNPHPKLIEESKQELRLLSHLRHPNIVLFMGACTAAEDFCVVTELMEGGSLFDILHKQQRQLDFWLVLQFARDIAYGMHYLHSQTPIIIHRDLKSGNLLINRYLHLKIADFGLARVKAESGVMTAETGSYRWMAPEVIRHEKYNEKVDVYSFALVVWEMLTGSMPFVGYTPVQAAMAVARQGTRPPIPSSCPSPLANLIEQCWANNAADRPAFGKVLQILDEIERNYVREMLKSSSTMARPARSI